MTRTLSLIVSILMFAFVLCGCGAIPIDIAPTVLTAVPTTTSVEATDSAGASSGTPETTVSAEPEEELSLMGELNGSQYINKALGFTATIPEGWLFSSDEDFEKSMGQKRDVTKTLSDMEPETYEPVFVCSKYTYGEGSSGYPNININYSNETAYKHILTDSSVLESTVNELMEMYESYFPDAEVKVVGQGAVDINNRKFIAVNFKLDSDDFTMYADQLYTGIKDGVLTTTLIYFNSEEQEIVHAFMKNMNFEA
jgi:hypothetical protein